MNKYLVRKRITENNQVELEMVSILINEENLVYEIIETPLSSEDRVDEYGEFFWNNESDSLDVRYLPKELEDRENTIEVLKRRIYELENADKNLGIDITDLDIRQIEHELTHHV